MRFGKIRVDLRSREHAPAHVHVIGPEGALVVFLDGGLTGPTRAVRASSEALAWVEANRAQLLARWKEVNG